MDSCAQALLFYIPRYLWKTWEAGKMKMLVLDLNCPIIAEDTKNERKKLLVDYFTNNMHNHNFYAIRCVAFLGVSFFSAYRHRCVSKNGGRIHLTSSYGFGFDFAILLRSHRIPRALHRFSSIPFSFAFSGRGFLRQPMKALAFIVVTVS